MDPANIGPTNSPILNRQLHRPEILPWVWKAKWIRMCVRIFDESTHPITFISFLKPFFIQKSRMHSKVGMKAIPWPKEMQIRPKELT